MPQDVPVTLTPFGQQQADAAQQRSAAPGAWAPPGAWSAPPTSKVLLPRMAEPRPVSPAFHAGAVQPQVHAHAPAGGARHDPLQQPLAVAVAEQAFADPVMREAIRQQAIAVGGHAADAAKYCGRKGLMAFQDYIQQGPQGVSVLCFVGGLATTALGGMSICNFFGTIMDPFHYLLNVYVFVFGLATAVIEADTDRVGVLMSPFDRLAEPLTRAQAWLHEECRLLTRLRGRGFFYLYQGTLMVTQCVFCLLFLCGLYLAIMGSVCILMSYGITPDVDFIAKSAGLGADGRPYSLVADSAGSSPSAEPDRLFRRAEAAWKRHKEQLPGKACRELWALSRQASDGDCSEPKPEGMFNGGAKEQWRLWKALQGVSEAEAKAMFVERLTREGIQL